MIEKSEDDLEDIDWEDLDKTIDDYRIQLDLNGHLKELEELQQDIEYSRDDLISAFCDRGKLLYKNNRYEDAILLLERALKYYPDQTELICCIGFASIYQESLDAITYFQRALGIDHRCSQAHYGLGLVELKLFSNPKASQRIQELLMALNPMLGSKLKNQITKFLMKRKI